MTPHPLRIVGFDLGVHLGCVALDVTAEFAVTLVARRTIQVGALVPLAEPVVHTRQNGSTWTQTTRREAGPGVARAAARKAAEWASGLGAEYAAVEWVKDLYGSGGHTPILTTSRVGQSIYEALERAGIRVELYNRQTALALVRRLAVAAGAPVVPGVVRHRGAELGPVLAAMVSGWAESVVERRAAARAGTGTKEEASDGEARTDAEEDVRAGERGPHEERAASLGAHEGGPPHLGGIQEAPPGIERPAQPLAAPSSEDRRPEHEIDAAIVALAHVAHLAGVSVDGGASKRAAGGTGKAARPGSMVGADGAPMGWRERAKARAKERRLTEGPDTSQRRPGAECKRCIRGDVVGPSHRKDCPKWKKWAA